jgi:hypothetical protein
MDMHINILQSLIRKINPEKIMRRKSKLLLLILLPFGLIFAVGWIISFVWTKKSESKLKITKIANDHQDLRFGITTLEQYQVA